MELKASNNQPNNEPIGYRKYKLEDDYEFKLERNGLTYTVIVKKGFVYDGASVPRIVWSLTGLTPDGLSRAGSLVHDAFYVYKGKINNSCKYLEVYLAGKKVKFTFSRLESDILFKKFLKHFKVKPIKTFIAYNAVRLGGWVYWMKKEIYE